MNVYMYIYIYIYSTALSYHPGCYHPGWRLMRLGYRTCFHTLYDEKKKYIYIYIYIVHMMWPCVSLRFVNSDISVDRLEQESLNRFELMIALYWDLNITVTSQNPQQCLSITTEMFVLRHDVRITSPYWRYAIFLFLLSYLANPNKYHSLFCLFSLVFFFFQVKKKKRKEKKKVKGKR